MLHLEPSHVSHVMATPWSVVVLLFMDTVSSKLCYASAIIHCPHLIVKVISMVCRLL